MYNTLENDKGQRINYIDRSHERHTHRISDISEETNKERRAFQRRETTKHASHRNRRVCHILSVSNSVVE